jgi:hypothetical protein
MADLWSTVENTLRGKGIQTGARYSTAAIEAEEGVSTATVAQVAR